MAWMLSSIRSRRLSRWSKRLSISAPKAVAVNLVTNQVNVANRTSNNVTVIDGTDNNTVTVDVGTKPSGGGSEPGNLIRPRHDCAPGMLRTISLLGMYSLASQTTAKLSANSHPAFLVNGLN